MNIVTTTSVFPRDFAAEHILDRLSEVGYSCLDMAFDYCVAADHPFTGANWLEWAQALRAAADRKGVRYTHAHACSSVHVRSEQMERCFEACRILGIGYLVIHPVDRLNDAFLCDAAEFIRINADAVRSWLPLAEKCGVTVLSENLLWGASSDPRVIADLVRAVDHPRFNWCFDTGHANFSGFGMDILREVSVVPQSLHLQDNHGPSSGDEHLLPGDGNIDWEALLRHLHQAGYRGELVLEAHHQSLAAADEERDDILRDLLSRALKMKAYLQTLE